MAGISVQIDMGKYSDWLRDAPEKIQKALSNVIKIAALLVERESKIKSPVDTGRLRSSIATDIFPLTATIRPNVNYAMYVHEGTRHMRGRPFMQEGVDAMERQLDAVVERELKLLE